MKQVFNTQKGIVTEDAPVPVPREKELLVKVHNSLISTGTETSSMKKAQSFLEQLEEKKKTLNKVTKKIKTDGLQPTWAVIKQKLLPSERASVLSPIGYSNAGVVVAKGPQVSSFNVGDRVACAGAGIAAHAEYVTVPVNLAARLPEEVAFEDAAFTTVGSIALQGIRRANLGFGETVAITGLGLLGLLAVQIAKAWGLIVIGIDLKPERIALAKSLGADACFLAQDNETENKIMQFTSGAGVDAAILYAATGSSAPANQALKICRKKGRVVIVGAVGMNLDREAMYMKELDFVMSTSYGPGRYDADYEIKGNDYPIGYVRWTENRNMLSFIKLLENKKIDPRRLKTTVFPVEQSVNAYDLLMKQDAHTVAVLFSYPEEKLQAPGSNKIVCNPVPLSKEIIQVGIIGAGGFASKVHLPNLLKLKNYYNLAAIANRSSASAKRAAATFKPNYITTEYHDILNDASIDMVVIGTRHNLHARMVKECLLAGKHVLVEKPLAMNYEELQGLRNTLEECSSYLTVGFNRRYSPLSVKAKEVLKKRGGPCIINYRVNAGYISPTSWAQDPVEGGGRIIGECCHFLDLFNFFVDSPVSQMHVAAIPVDGTSIESNDNLVVTVQYKNGSVAVLSYVSIGAKGKLPKERIEIFSGQSAMVINDFKGLEFYGLPERTIRLASMDKGQLQELAEFAKLIKGQQSSIISIENAFLATEQTLEIINGLNKDSS